MGFLGIYRALYDYSPQAEAELEIAEGDLLYVLDKSDDDDWWKAKKRAGTEEDEEPVGLVPSNYIEKARPVGHARSLYEYTRQTDEELSFPEDAALEVFDTTDPDWILVGLDDDYGFVPSNYIEFHNEKVPDVEQAAPPPLPARSPADDSPPETGPDTPDRPQGRRMPPSGPGAALASVLQSQGRSSTLGSASPPQPQPPRPDSIEPTDSEEPRSPALPARPVSSMPSPRETRVARRPSPPPAEQSYADPSRAPRGFHMYNINEMMSVMGKRKKMPTTLGINIADQSILIAPEHAKDGPSQEWSGNKMTHYSREGKHVFLELVRPTKSVDFHAGAKDTAEEIVAALGELAAAVRADGLQASILSPTAQTLKSGQILYDFMAQGDDEVTVTTGDDVVILDDTKSDEWWHVRRTKNGKEGVVPSSYVEITGFVSPQPRETNAARSTVEQNRLDEIRLTKQAVRFDTGDDPSPQVGPGMLLPERGSSLQANEQHDNSSQQRSKRRENGRDGAGQQTKGSKSKPDPSKIRTWTDSTKSFSVEAQFLGVKDGKINLHKINGVKIAVPLAKMSREDLDYVERTSGHTFDSRGGSRSKTKSSGDASGSTGSQVGASVEPRKPDYDWFQFFLDCDVNVGLCERYAQAFVRESMAESILADVDANVLRTLGLREGDIIKVMKAIDAKFGRGKNEAGGDDGKGGLFSGPGGTLRNNTRKGRPAPAVQTGDVVDPAALSQPHLEPNVESKPSSVATREPSGQHKAPALVSGFEDDAWDVKPTKPDQKPARSSSTLEAPATKATPPPAALTGSMQELSLLTAPLTPTAAEPPSVATVDGASQPLRQRPSVQPMPTGQGALAPPPPARPLSAPQTAQLSAFSPPPIGPQMTGSVHPALQGQVAPLGQSLGEMNQARMNSQYLQQMHTAQAPMYATQVPAATGINFATNAQGPPMLPTMTGPGPMPPVGQYVPMQQQPGFPGQLQAQQTFNQLPTAGINNYLPPAMEPQRTGLPMTTGPGIPPPPAPLVPQQTGPPPPVRFGVQADAPRMMPQATGRRANLAQATPDNPFGF